MKISYITHNNYLTRNNFEYKNSPSHFLNAITTLCDNHEKLSYKFDYNDATFDIIYHSLNYFNCQIKLLLFERTLIIDCNRLCGDSRYFYNFYHKIKSLLTIETTIETLKNTFFWDDMSVPPAVSPLPEQFVKKEQTTEQEYKKYEFVTTLLKDEYFENWDEGINFILEIENKIIMKMVITNNIKVIIKNINRMEDICGDSTIYCLLLMLNEIYEIEEQRQKIIQFSNFIIDIKNNKRTSKEMKKIIEKIIK